MTKLFVGGSGSWGGHNEKYLLERIRYGEDWEIVDDYKDADIIIIIDSCIGSYNSMNATLGYLDEITKKKKPGAKLILSGCLANGFKIEINDKVKELLSNYEVVPTKDILNYAIRLSDPEFKGLDYNIAYSLAFHKAQLSVVSGCINHCTFCKTNYMNFPLESHPLDKIEKMLKELDRVYKDKNPLNYILCTNSNFSLYGVDLYGEQKAHEVIKILTSLDSTKYTEFGAIINWYPELINEIISNPKVKGIFTSLESGSERIYGMMNRPIELNKLKEIIKTIRKERPDIFIRSEMIAGFPTETIDDLKRTIDTFYELDINPAYIWPYINSPFIKSNDYPQYKKNYIGTATRYAKEKLQPLIDAQDAKERYEAYVTEKSDEYNGYQLLFPNGDTEFVRYERINGNYNEGDIIAKNDIKPKYLVKKNRNKDKTSN